jgi:hypothetical protein
MPRLIPSDSEGMRKTLCMALIAALAASVSLPALDLSVSSDDVRITQSPEGGYNLYIRKKADVGSVLLTETTRDPKLKADNYAYRVKEWNPVNGDERRMLDGAIIPPEKKIYSLIDSTTETDTPIGEAFHIWVPYLIYYGYDWSRNGEVQVLDGTFVNIRAFEKPYADYSGSFADNPFRIRVTQKPIVRPQPPDVTYMKDTVDCFTDLASKTNGEVFYAKGPDDLIPLIKDALDPPGEKPLDLVFVIDSTESMQDDIAKLRDLMEPVLREELPKYPSWRIALVLYKDYFEDFLVKEACPFTDDISVFRKALGSFRVQGGRDIPEAVYEALNGGLAYPWNPVAEKRIILIGDAPPHPKPRGKITKEMVFDAAARKGVRMSVIILPHGETY